MDRRESRNRIRTYFSTPEIRATYPKQLQFFQLGATTIQRALFGGNRSGKSVAGCYEMVCHLTGDYPDWWPGIKFDHPVSAWAAGDTSKNVRDILQDFLVGPHGDSSAQGTGLIPGDLIVRTTTKHGIADALETVYVKHASGGISSLQFKSYDQGREAFQGTSQDVIHLDEEPPDDIYTECLLRTMTVNGIIYLTATPLQGLTKLLIQFLPHLAPTADDAPKKAETESKAAIFVSWEDAPHLTEQQKASILASIPPWQRDARTKGIPQLGAGAIYQVPESDFVIPGFEIPKHWPRSYGLDVGWNRTATIWTAWDRDTDTVYMYDEYYRGQVEPSVHAAAIKQRGAWIPGVIDPAGRGRSQIDGRKLTVMYTDLGLNLELAVNTREAGIYHVWERLSQGRLKVFSSCVNTLSEYRLYRRNERGEIVKANDHLMDALRYDIISGLPLAIVEPTSRPDGKQWFHWSPPTVWAG